MIGPSAAPPRRRWSSASPATGAASIRTNISRAGRASSRPTPMPDTTSFTIRSVRPDRWASALCWSHARRKFFELADVESNIRKGKSPKDISPITFEAVKRIDALFEIERDINGKSPDERLEARHTPVGTTRPGSGALAAWRASAALEARQGRQGDRLPAVAEALAGLHPVPRGWPYLSQQQCRRAVPARRGSRQEILALRRVRTGRTSRRRHVFPDRKRQAERHRSAGLAR